MAETSLERNYQLVQSGGIEMSYSTKEIGSQSKGTKNIESTMPEGFYHLISESEPDPVLVHGYYCSDMDGAFVFGFNTHDGGGLLPLDDLKKDTKVVPVVIIPKTDFDDLVVTSGGMYRR